MIDRAIGLAGLGLAVLSPILPAMFPVLNKKIGWAGFILGLLLLGSAAGIAFFPNGEAQSPPTITQGTGDVYSSGQKGGVTVGTINEAPPPPQIINGNCNMFGGTNGSFNCNNTYNGVPAPELKYQTMSIKEDKEGYHVRILANLVSPFPPGKLRVEVHAPAIQGREPSPIDIVPDGAGMAMMGPPGVNNGFPVATILSPQPGPIFIQFTTRENPAGKITLYSSF